MKKLLEALYVSGAERYKTERWITLEEAHALYFLIQTEKIAHYYESGTANGFSACWGALAQRDLEQDQRVHTWDPFRREKLWEWPSYRELAPRIVYHEASYHEGLRGAWRPSADRSLFFLDGDHRSAAVKRDLEATMALAVPGDVILFHDINSYMGVRRAYKRLRREHRAARITTDRGMGVVWL